VKQSQPKPSEKEKANCGDEEIDLDLFLLVSSVFVFVDCRHASLPPLASEQGRHGNDQAETRKTNVEKIKGQ